jgi:hypothetical protein
MSRAISPRDLLGDVTSWSVVGLRKERTAGGDPCQLYVRLSFAVGAGKRRATLVVNPGLLRELGVEDADRAFASLFDSVPDLEYARPVLDAAETRIAALPLEALRRLVGSLV